MTPPVSEVMENFKIEFEGCPCGKFHVNVSFTKSGIMKYIKPQMDWDNEKIRNIKSECPGWYDVVVRCVTKMPPEEVMDCVIGHTCRNWWLEKQFDKRKILSCSDAIAVAIIKTKEKFQAWKEVKE
jgi:hypothetical protein